MGKTIDVDDYKWELYNVDQDFSEANDLAAKNPKKLGELQDVFWIETAKYNVLPLDNSKIERMDVANRPSLTTGRSVFTFYSCQVRIPEGSAPDLKNKSYKIAADVGIPEGGEEGVIATEGGRFNGWGLCLLGGKPTFHYNLVDVQRTTVADQNKLALGKHTIVVDFQYEMARASARTALLRCSWTVRRSPLAIFPGPFRFVSRRTRHSTSAKTPAHP